MENKFGRKTMPENMRRTIRETTNFNQKESKIAQLNMINAGYTEMATYLRALAMHTTNHAIINVPPINKEAMVRVAQATTALEEALEQLEENKEYATNPKKVQKLLDNSLRVIEFMLDLAQKFMGELNTKEKTNIARSLTKEELIKILIEK